MGRPAGWMTQLTGRGPMSSPAAPSHRREVERGFWREIAKGLLAEEAAEVVGASQAVGARWFRHGGGMSPFDLKAFSGRYLTFAEREEIALSAYDLICRGGYGLTCRSWRGDHGMGSVPVTRVRRSLRR